ncbi:MAG: hypothetical protein KKH74_10820 [Gammaproteobacteria bacterium]|nr:hypothetical protein [Gammaproteobacteria bacterium]MBU1731424.1 hypothetical protein [Gammaproteobacteria bacterium]MBU1892929.1 hypothetical protein [Gammaproteobacteria bacterium]
MNRILFGIVIGSMIAALVLWLGDSLFTHLLVWLRLPGWLLVIGIYAMFVLLILVYLSTQRADLAKGDLRNFLPGIVSKCLSITGTFIGIGLFAGLHWAVTQTGYGHAVFMLSLMISAPLGWIAYGLGSLYIDLVETYARDR